MLDYRLEVVAAPSVGRAQLAALLGKDGRERLLVFAPQVTPQAGERLREHGIDYIDLAGNCHIEAGGDHVAHVEGKKTLERVSLPREHGRTSHFGVYFALAARPELATAPVREIARHAGAGKSTVDRTLARLHADGLLAVTSKGRRLLRRDALIDRWVAGYVEHVRSKWVVGRYAPATREPEALERVIATALRGKTWGLGGAAGGWRLDRYYRGEDTVVHLAKPDAELPRRLRVIPAAQGSLVIMVTPVPLAFTSDVEDTVHPLLIYGEMVATSDERSLGAAARIRERFLATP